MPKPTLQNSLDEDSYVQNIFVRTRNTFFFHSQGQTRHSGQFISPFFLEAARWPCVFLFLLQIFSSVMSVERLENLIEKVHQKPQQRWV